MTPRRTLLGAVVLFALSIACIRPEATPDTQPLAPPDTLTPPTTVPLTTTTLDVERAAVYPVDPITLEAVAGFDPIPVGDWAWGISSKNGSWLALSVGYDNQNQTEMRLIDIDNWAVAANWLHSVDSPLYVADDGTIYVINGSTPTYRMSRLIPGETSPAAIADLPPHFMWNELHVHDGRALIFGFLSPNDTDQGVATIVTVDLASGLVTGIPLPNVEMGTIGELDTGAGPTSFYVSPAVVWDDDRSRVLLVEANRDEVTEVNVETAEVTEHQFGTGALDTTPTADHAFANGLRWAVLGRPSGAPVLYVATATQTFEVVDDDLTVTYASEGIEEIDTSTWEITDFLDEPISSISISPAGDRLLASGEYYADISGGQESRASGLYVIDPVDLEIIAHHGADQPDQYYGGFSFDPDMRIGYAMTWDQMANLNVVSLEDGSIVNTMSDNEIQFFPEAGVLIEVFEIP